MISSLSDLCYDVAEAVMQYGDCETVFRVKKLSPQSVWHQAATERIGDLVTQSFIDVPPEGLPTADVLQIGNFMETGEYRYCGDPYRARPDIVVFGINLGDVWGGQFKEVSLDGLRSIASKAHTLKLQDIRLSASNIDFYASLGGRLLTEIQLEKIRYEHPELLFRLIHDMIRRSANPSRVALYTIDADFQEYIVKFYRMGLARLFESNRIYVSDGVFVKKLLDAWVETGHCAVFNLVSKTEQSVDVPVDLELRTTGSRRIVATRVVVRGDGRYHFMMNQQESLCSYEVRIIMTVVRKQQNADEEKK
ncbi:hypothetical protein QR680_010822 [Steinernema hermaphroditum]|uniref:Uncharacterized protein n=1 Tax=Steinernema hermaphroditum TaxID=289476 RepID=A0AA39MC65_9BILA|nr:hypothetical protein QR680_010822 [Steinernema hermaphroditum]